MKLKMAAEHLIRLRQIIVQVWGLRLRLICMYVFVNNESIVEFYLLYT